MSWRNTVAETPRQELISNKRRAAPLLSTHGVWNAVAGAQTAWLFHVVDDERAVDDPAELNHSLQS